MNKLKFAFRANTDADMPYILRSWIMTWRSEQRNRDLHSYSQQAGSLFRSILDRYGAVVVCNPDNPEQIYAFAIATYLTDGEWVLFWIHVKSIYSQLGIGTALFKFIKQDRTNGPICPFVRARFKGKLNKYDILDAPYSVANILAMPITDSPTKELNE